MRVLFLVDGDVHEPAARTRVYGLLTGLSEFGIETRAMNRSDRAGAGGKLRVLRAARWADVVVLQRILPPPPLLALLARVNPRLVFDFDDALYTVPAMRKRLRAALESAVEVVAGSTELARHVRPIARSVTVIPTVVDPASYTPASGPGDRDRVRVGWTGTPGNLPYLELARPALQQLTGRGRDFELRVISSGCPSWPELAVTHVPWTPVRGAAALAELDIGIAPLPDTPWTRGKSPMKVLEYMASAIPVLASPVGGLGEMVVQGETGFLAAGTPEWIEHLDVLVTDSDLRRRLGRRGRRRVEERYSVAAVVPALARVFERAAATARRTAA